MRHYWGTQMSMVFQDPMTSLNPVMRIGKQITEPLRYHLDVTRDYAQDTALALLQSVGIPEAERRLREYPHQLSGGMRQRVMIAIALACGPKLLFADEPTTALDVTVQAQILDLLHAQQRERFMAMVLVTHDLGVVAGRADNDRGDVCRSDRRVRADAGAVQAKTRHPYTEALLKSIPKLAQPSHTRLEADHRTATRPRQSGSGGCKFAARCPYAQARCVTEEPGLGDSEFSSATRSVVSIPVGTDGREGHLERNVAAGVTATGMPISSTGSRVDDHVESCRLMAGIGYRAPAPGRRDAVARREPGRRVPRRAHRTEGQCRHQRQPRREGGRDARPGRRVGLRQVDDRQGDHAVAAPEVRQTCLFEGADMTQLGGEELRGRPGRSMKMIFQDPISSLNPRRKVEDIIAEGLRIWKIGSDEEQQQKVDEAMLAVGLDPALQRGRRPHQFSGGQCQRISIARAVVTDPKLIICDEPVSALDVSVQAQILNLLEDMKKRYGLTLIFIAHDLAVVKNVSDRVVVMYLGKICEVEPPRRAVQTAGPPVHGRTVGVDSGPGSEHQAVGAAGTGRRDPVAGRAAERLSVPNPVSEGAGPVRGRGTRDPPSFTRPVRRVSLSDGARRDPRHPQRSGVLRHGRRTRSSTNGSSTARAGQWRGKAEHPLGEDVLVHLRGAPGDGERPTVDTVTGPLAAQRVGTEDVRRELGDMLFGLAPQQLRDASFRAHRAGRAAQPRAPGRR